MEPKYEDVFNYMLADSYGKWST